MNMNKVLNLHTITVHNILPRADKIKIRVRSLLFMGATKVSRILIGVMGKMEEMLATCNGDENQRDALVCSLFHNGSRSLCLTT
jgi:hypothetical protein